MSKVKAWEQIKIDFPNITLSLLSEYEKQQIVNEKPSGKFSCLGYYYTVYSDGTYDRHLIPYETRL